MMRLRNLSSCPSFTLLPAAKAVDRRTLRNALRERTANAFVKLFDSGLWFSYLSLAEFGRPDKHQQVCHRYDYSEHATFGEGL